MGRFCVYRLDLSQQELPKCSARCVVPPSILLVRIPERLTSENPARPRILLQQSHLLFALDSALSVMLARYAQPISMMPSPTHGTERHPLIRIRGAIRSRRHCHPAHTTVAVPA